MKLTDTQIENALLQIDDRAIPEDHPALPQLKELYGDHTFFLGSDGLKIAETADEPEPGAGIAACLIKVASWTDAERTTLATHEPEATDTVFMLAAPGSNSAV